MLHSRPAEWMTAQPWLARLILVAAGCFASAGCEIRDGATDSPASAHDGSPPIATASPEESRDSRGPGPAGSAHRSEAIAEQRRPAGAADRAIEFVEGYQRGLDLARQARRPMLLFFTADWCQYCHQLAQEAFRDEKVVELSHRFVCVIVDADAEPEICRRFQVRGYPTVLFVSPRATPLSRIVGKQPPQDFVVRMQAALQSVARSPDRVQRR